MKFGTHKLSFHLKKNFFVTLAFCAVLFERFNYLIIYCIYSIFEISSSSFFALYYLFTEFNKLKILSRASKAKVEGSYLN